MSQQKLDEHPVHCAAIWEIHQVLNSSSSSPQGIKTEVNRCTVLGVRGFIQTFVLFFWAWYAGAKLPLHGMEGSATTTDKAWDGFERTMPFSIDRSGKVLKNRKFNRIPPYLF